jgi:hypothetical protein
VAQFGGGQQQATAYVLRHVLQNRKMKRGRELAGRNSITGVVDTGAQHPSTSSIIHISTSTSSRTTSTTSTSRLGC